MHACQIHVLFRRTVAVGIIFVYEWIRCRMRAYSRKIGIDIYLENIEH